MRLHVNRDTNSLIVGFTNPEQVRTEAGSNSITGKRGDTTSYDWLFGRPFTTRTADEIDLGDPITTFKFGVKRDGDFPGNYVISNWNGAAFAYTKTGGSTFADGVTNSDTSLVSATAAFVATDVGLAVTGAGIPANTTIAAVSSATTAVLSAATTAVATGVTIVIAGRTPTYSVRPSLNTVELNRLLVIGTIGEIVADQAALYALTGKAVGYIVEQTDTGEFWEVIDADELDNADGWGYTAQHPHIDLMGELEVHQASGITSTLTFGVRIYNDVNRGSEGVPTTATPSYPAPELIALRTVAGKYRIKDDGTFQLWNAGESTWHALAIVGGAGAEQLTIAAGEA